MVSFLVVLNQEITADCGDERNETLLDKPLYVTAKNKRAQQLE
jgi:hypothetical protein